MGKLEAEESDLRLPPVCTIAPEKADRFFDFSEVYRSPPLLGINDRLHCRDQHVGMIEF
ncbi:hypothetical protein FHS26_003671 [Rhizobium pisi]|uniref:Uncharacterized protein n=1 Tax=Rhizobium pisi TaxID=574561 RepID=A0A7W5BNH2_9HYPH|nr:hypothetical protein [Rhizobium pisi]MBB3135924.1 hypothetical protein [Rhizobium pisi]